MTDAATETRSVVVEREFPYAPERLWRALTQPHLIEAWLMKNDFRPEVGCRYAHDDPAYALNSVVTFTLTPTGTGTHLRMEQAGFRPDQRQAFGGAGAGWRTFLDKLDQTLGQADPVR